MIVNENEYVDDHYADATIDLTTAVTAMWEAGATIQNIQDEMENALMNATGSSNVDVRLEVE